MTPGGFTTTGQDIFLLDREGAPDILPPPLMAAATIMTLTLTLTLTTTTHALEPGCPLALPQRRLP